MLAPLMQVHHVAASILRFQHEARMVKIAGLDGDGFPGMSKLDGSFVGVLHLVGFPCC